jgi:hypothetical protein
MGFPEQFDSTYFGARRWSERLDEWRQANAAHPFALSNEGSIRRRFADPDTAPHVVVNIGTSILKAFLAEGHYLNVYDLEKRVGGPSPSRHRQAVDARVGIGENTYFAAASMGGAGLRYFGEYCLVLRLDRLDPTTQLIDRDSYDVEFSPLDDVSDEDIRAVLLGQWSEVEDMILLRVLPRIEHDRQLVTSGTVIELAISDQEYIEVHLRASFTPQQVDQVVEAPESTAAEARILERERRGLTVAMHEHEWARERAEVARLLEGEKLRHRVVTQHGRGYQWI